MKITIYPENVQVNSHSGTSKKSGNQYTINTQVAFFDSGTTKFPIEIKLNLDEGQKPYPAGDYSICPTSFIVDTYKNLNLSRIKILPIKK
ncbi:MAG: G5P family DNA-binding protein [Gammaproteobacteria bacterium]|nr:G5P family DNA-binding protein [Gammaproteobacteria bacterium]MDH5629890.1 G5P family DNA-binding protein [Gammaproteobacteria bacterium]